MALTESSMVQLGSPLPDFSLPNVLEDGQPLITPRDLTQHNALLVMFICNHCPFVVHVAEGLSALYEDYATSGLGIIAINSNDVQSYPEDSPPNMKRFATQYAFAFPYLFDETQEVAKTFKATCTPDFFLYDKDQILFYRGQMDDSRPGTGTPVTGKDLRAAIDATLNGKAIPSDQIPSAGCNIKWK